ncbi:UDP-glucose 4-epimerase [Aspergillus japonicus CBS 114.51]|uniref:UDP-glucose 4-epimerase n=3 Tax=Aspergillus TaxID=5052 RepID=A0A2V5HD25_ASPV1|nr:UDP-glucose 4-epimerase [Aspergillus japonicus CBS 114.51]PYI19714.1 UDP-glucose 4-epimerase [Aspergillus violaceofuscus CBS 115571]PYI29705.1 UDP-glucose 4-epimerase [Aspergillus indologenus CBS 114.80]RAH78221.1 UDP-glucose 4-epimerase [Aspergillus japonicus CBS 114.51]
MESPRQSDASTPVEPNSPGFVDTPATQSSVLFDGNLEELLRNFPLDQYILVTGGLGFIGSHTTLELLKANYNVIVIDNLSNSFQSVFDRIKLLASKHHEQQGTCMPSLQLHAHDFRDTVALRELLDQYQTQSRWGSPKSKIAGVIHFAAYKAVEESIRNPLKYYANNVSGLIDFATTLGDYGIKTFIFSSSATVYGTLATSGLPLKEELCVHKDETFTDHNGSEQLVQAGCTGITNPYGRTKWICEAILADLAASDPEWTIVALRYFNPIGCDESGLLGEDPRQIPTNLLPVVVKVMTGQYAELQMFGTDWDTEDGTAVRDFIHVTDLARGHIAALSAANGGKLAENFRTFNLGTGRGHSVMEVVNTMESVSSKPIPRKAAGRRAGDVGSCVAVATRSQNELEWKTEKTLKDACVSLCNFLDVSGLSA